MKFKSGSAEGHRVLHVLKRHGVGQKGSASHGTLFNVDGKTLLETIGKVYSNNRIVKTVLRDDGKIDYYYEAGKVIGLEGETKVKMIFENGDFITAYPVSKIPE